VLAFLKKSILLLVFANQEIANSIGIGTLCWCLFDGAEWQFELVFREHCLFANCATIGEQHADLDMYIRQYLDLYMNKLNADQTISDVVFSSGITTGS
jgi:hypothetical protein